VATPVPLTIGVPVYNGEPYLAEALDSLLSQDFTDFRVVVADNASTDATPDICSDYHAKDDRITYVRHATNIGGAGNWTWLAERATSPLFKWASADDVCAPQMLSACVGALDEHPGAVLAYPRTVMMDEDGIPVEVCRHRLHVLDEDPAVRIHTVTMALYHANALHGVIRTRPLQETSLIQPWLGSDFTTLSELALRGSILEVPELLFFRRRTPQSLGLGTLDRRARQEWFKPGAKTSVVPPAWRVSWNNDRAIAHAPLSATDRLRCHVAYRQARGQKMLRRGRNLARRMVGLPRNTERDQEAPLPGDLAVPTSAS
jgi:glycosyltransferase involved in cell wall biosynthesis